MGTRLHEERAAIEGTDRYLPAIPAEFRIFYFNDRTFEVRIKESRNDNFDRFVKPLL